MSDSDDDFRSSDKTKTRRSVVRTQNIPNGHCLLHHKWKNQNVAQSISKVLTVKFVGDLPHADFQPSAKTFVVYLVSWSKYRIVLFIYFISSCRMFRTLWMELKVLRLNLTESPNMEGVKRTLIGCLSSWRLILLLNILGRFKEKSLSTGVTSSYQYLK